MNLDAVDENLVNLMPIATDNIVNQPWGGIGQVDWQAMRTCGYHGAKVKSDSTTRSVFSESSGVGFVQLQGGVDFSYITSTVLHTWNCWGYQ